jgi:cardiolipin synthase A/B
MPPDPWYTLAFLIADWLIRIGLSLRVIMRRLPVGVSLAWLTVILVFPYAGALMYLMFGELRLGRKRERRAAAIRLARLPQHESLGPKAVIDWRQCGAGCEPMSRIAAALLGNPPLAGNALQLLENAEATFRALIDDIEAAERSVYLEFYIWENGGLADELADALARAAERGVECRVLLDAVGSRPFLRSRKPRELRERGIEIRAALKAGVIRMLFVRFDLRLHRKIAVIDGRIGYAGSMNLVDPRFFKQTAGVGEWVDAMARVTGPTVEALGLVIEEDWELETGEKLVRKTAETAEPADAPRGPSVVQVLASGPAVKGQAIQDVLLSAIYSARRELMLTTPYFVPDELLLTALASAAWRGVDVTLIVPARVDSKLVRLASSAQRGDLAQAGVKIMEYRGGLLHTKSVTADGELSLFGSLNLDPRSQHLNFEITLAVYDRQFTADLRRLQCSYLGHCTPFDLPQWQRRSFPRRLAQDAGRLVSPLL